MALAGSTIARLPLTTSLLYLGVGVMLGPSVSGLLRIDTVAHASTLEVITEIAVIISLFTAGLKLRVPISDRRWRLPLRLAVLSMTVTVGLVATACVFVLGVPWGVGFIVGAIVAPTDPVLASDVQVTHPFDEHRLRFALTGEASLNDGTALPFLLLGLGLLGAHELGDNLWRWWAVDVVWSTAAGLTIGGALGTLVGQIVLYLRRTHREAVGLDDFLALGLIALAYGGALAAQGNGFLSVFAAGLALRRVERMSSAGRRAQRPSTAVATGDDAQQKATDPTQAPAYMAQAVLAFNEQLERIGEVTVVVIVGALLATAHWSWPLAAIVALLFFVIRPLSIAVGLAGSEMDGRERALSAWFGVRGVGSAFYLAFALTHGLPAAFQSQVVSATLAVVAASIVMHGVTVTPLMTRWGEEKGGRMKAKG